MYFTGSICSSRGRHWRQLRRCSYPAARLESASLSNEYSSSALSEGWPWMACSTALRSSEGIDCGSTTDGVALRLTPLSVVGDGECSASEAVCFVIRVKCPQMSHPRADTRKSYGSGTPVTKEGIK